jgi:hypothetical protein
VLVSLCSANAFLIKETNTGQCFLCCCGLRKLPLYKYTTLSKFRQQLPYSPFLVLNPLLFKKFSQRSLPCTYMPGCRMLPEPPGMLLLLLLTLLDGRLLKLNISSIISTGPPLPLPPPPTGLRSTVLITNA